MRTALLLLLLSGIAAADSLEIGGIVEYQHNSGVNNPIAGLRITGDAAWLHYDSAFVRRSKLDAGNGWEFKQRAFVGKRLYIGGSYAYENTRAYSKSSFFPGALLSTRYIDFYGYGPDLISDGPKWTVGEELKLRTGRFITRLPLAWSHGKYNGASFGVTIGVVLD